MAATTELDFEGIKNNIVTFLKSQPEFTDFEFEGAGITVLMDILTYVTHYMGVYGNMSFSEIFMDSAQLRSSIVSRAKEHGYMPRQSQAAVANINLKILNPAGSPASIEVPKGTQFVSSIDGQSYQFVTTDAYSLTDQGGGDYNASFDIAQGRYQTFRFNYDVTAPKPFILPDKFTVDLDHITVRVKATAAADDSTAVEWKLSTDITSLGPTSKAYFMQETSDGKVEIYFGDGVLGSKLTDQNQVIVDYLVTDGKDANYANVFSLVNPVGGYATNLFILETISQAAGGSAEESIESIRHIAPKIYQAQGRAVTEDDYRAILLDKYGWIESLNVWGGERNVPKIFGKVFISIKPDYGETTTTAVKESVVDYLDKFKIVGIVPEVIDPDYIYIDAATKFIWDKETTTKTQVELEALVAASITAYFSTNLTSNFDANLNYSKLLAAIDGAAHAIVNNETSLMISKKFVPNTLDFFTYEFEFANSIVPGTFISKPWTTVAGRTYQFKDDSAGNVDLYMDDVLVLGESNKHTIDYDTGKVILDNWNADITIGNKVTLSAQPVSNNVASARNILLAEGEVTITSDFLR